MSSVRAIANELGISRTTVSRALNHDARVRPDTRQRIMAVANRTGYRGQRSGAQAMIAYTVSTGHPGLIGTAYLSTLVGSVCQAANEARFDLALIDMHRDKRPDESYTRFFLSRGVQGVVMRAPRQDYGICREIAREGFPIVLISDQIDDPRVSYFCYDSYVGSHQAISYLAQLGHRRIAYIGKAAASADVADRYRGYEQAMADAGLPIDPALVARHVERTAATGANLLGMLMELPDPPTAVYVDSDAVVVQVINKAHAMGLRIPDDLSIIGFDNADTRHSVFPVMTAVCQDTRLMGYEAAEHLIRRIGQPGEHPPVHKVIPTFFEVNQTTAKPPLPPRRR